MALNAMLEQGTSVVEAKSGYGLTLEDEVKSLEAIRDAARQWPGEVVPTLLRRMWCRRNTPARRMIT